MYIPEFVCGIIVGAIGLLSLQMILVKWFSLSSKKESGKSEE